MHSEGVQVPGIHAHGVGRHLERPVQLVWTVHLYQPRQTQLPGPVGQFPEGRSVERADDEQYGASPVDPGLIQLRLFQNEVLPQQRHRHGPAHLVQVPQRAAEMEFVGQNRNRHRPADHIRPRVRRRRQVLGDGPGGWRPALDLPNDGDLQPAERRVPPRWLRGLSGCAPQRGALRAKRSRPGAGGREDARQAASHSLLRFGLYSGILIRYFFGDGAMPLTRRQKQILDYLESYIRSNGYAPSFEEIAEHFSFHSLATVHEHLTNLERKGYISRIHNESRSIEIAPVRGRTGATEIPLLGQVAAGEPIEAVATAETLAVPDDLIPRRGSSYALRVRGDSMIGEHIQDGDYVVVHSRSGADEGDMVIALVHGTSATVKRLFREPGGWVRLEPANEAVPPIRVHEDDVLIQGVVVGVMRRY